MGENEPDESHLHLLIQDHGCEDTDEDKHTRDGSVDVHGRPPLKSNTGTWRACPFILGNECCERLAYYGITTNLVTYLITKFHLSNATAAKTVNTWSGTCYLTPLLGALLADSYWGKYWTIAIFSTLYFIGMSLLTLSASASILQPPSCYNDDCPKASDLQYGVFFCGLYLIAVGAGGIKPCVSSFGADQFDDTDSVERNRKGSFFNWYYFSISAGSLISSSIVVWVQDNVGWGWGFVIPTAFMAVAIIMFFLGTPLYRFQSPGGSPISRIFKVIVASIHNYNKNVPQDSSMLYEVGDKHSVIQGSRKIEHTNEFKFLDRAAIIEKDSDIRTSNPWTLSSVTQVEELKILLRMFPIWVPGIVYSAVYAQMPTMFVEQGIVMDTSLGSFKISPASLSLFEIVSAITWVLIYDRIIVPVARKYTGKDRGITQLQRMGIGLLISTMSMIAAAIVESVRLNIVHKYHLIHDTATIVPMSILWQIPQYCLIGIGEVFYFIGKVEFFYDQAPDAMRSLCSAFALLVTAFAHYLSSLLITIVSSTTTKRGKPGWIPDNLNEGHLDYFFLMFAILSLLNLFAFIGFACKYKYKEAN